MTGSTAHRGPSATRHAASLALAAAVLAAVVGALVLLVAGNGSLALLLLAVAVTWLSVAVSTGAGM